MATYGYDYRTLGAGFHSGMGWLGASPSPVAAGTDFDWFTPGTGWGLWGGTVQEAQTSIINELLATGKFNSITARVVSNHDGYIGDSYSVEIIGQTKIGLESQQALEQLIWKAIGGAGLMADPYPSKPGTFVAPGTTNILQTPAAGIPASSVGDQQHGIATILGDPDTGDFDVIYSDPNAASGIFNEQGYFYNGNQDGIDHLAVTTDDSGADDGFVAFMKDGSEVYFDLQGNFVDSWAPTGTGSVAPVITPGMTPAQIAAAIAAAKNAATGTGQGTLDKLGASLGLTGVGAALGIGAGTLLIIAGIVAYGVIKK